MRRRGFLAGLGLAGGAAWGRPFALPPGRIAPATAAGPIPAPPPAPTRRRSLAAGLADLEATIGARLTTFDGSHVVATSNAVLAPPPGGANARLMLDGAVVGCRSRVVPAADRADASDIEVAFRVGKGRLAAATLAVTVTIDRWARDAYVMIPGAVYGGNRFASRHIPFPPLLAEPADIGPNVPPIIADVPRLNIQPGESRIVLASADTAVPALAVRVPGRAGDRAFGIVLLADPTTSLGQTALSIEENLDRSRATLWIGTPAVRPDVRYSVCNNRIPSADRGAALDAGSTVLIRMRVLVFPCPDVQTLYDRWFEVRRDRVGPVKLHHALPLSAGRRLIEERLREQWIDAPGFYATRPAVAVATATATATVAAAAAPAGDAARAESTFQTGADGALALALPALLAGGADAREPASAVLALQLRGQTAAGLFHAAGDGAIWWDEGELRPGSAAAGAAATSTTGSAASPTTALIAASTATTAGTAAAEARGARSKRWTHVGRNAETLYLACKQVLLLKRLDSSYRPSDRWRTGLARTADAFVRLWTKYKQLGQYVNCETGDIAIGGSAAGALAPAALTLAAEVLDVEAYLRTAATIAEAFQVRFVEPGLTLGGAPAGLQCPDSRSAAGLLESFVRLAEATGESVWFDRAASVAHQLATWTVAWDVSLPESSTLGKLGARTTGAVLVSAQDKWALPGWPGLSGDGLFRLYRATGRVAYLELLRETIHNSTGYIASDDRLPTTETRPGWVAGRIPMGDALGAPGEVPGATPNGAAQASCLMSAVEIPSIYCQSDTGFLFVFDHVEARVAETTPTRLKISVHNPTRFAADVRIFSESSRDRSQRLGAFALLDARSLTLGPGATDEIELPRSSA